MECFFLPTQPTRWWACATFRGKDVADYLQSALMMDFMPPNESGALVKILQSAGFGLRWGRWRRSWAESTTHRIHVYLHPMVPKLLFFTHLYQNYLKPSETIWHHLKPSETIWNHLKPHHFCQPSLAFPNFPPSRLVGPVSFACAKPPGWPSCQRRRARCCASARCSWRCWRPRRAPWSQRLGAPRHPVGEDGIGRSDVFFGWESLGWDEVEGGMIQVSITIYIYIYVCVCVCVRACVWVWHVSPPNSFSLMIST